MAHYAAEDTHVTYRLYEVLKAKLHSHPELVNILHNIRNACCSCTPGMEEDGIKLDHQFWINSVSSSLKRFKRLKLKAAELAGEAFNVASPKQVGEFYSKKLGLKGE